MIKYIYVASPYTNGQVGENVRNNVDAGNVLAEMGFIPFIPLLSHYWHMMFEHDHEFWMKQDLAWLEKCDAILRLPGESRGADREVKFAHEHGIKIFIYGGEIKDLASWLREYITPDGELVGSYSWCQE